MKLETFEKNPEVLAQLTKYRNC